MTDLDALLAQLVNTAPANPRAAALANASLAVGCFAARWADGDEAALGDGKISAAYEATATRLGGREHAHALASALPATERREAAAVVRAALADASAARPLPPRSSLRPPPPPPPYLLSYNVAERAFFVDGRADMRWLPPSTSGGTPA